MATIRIDPRFRGPRTSGNGGVTCGLVAAFIDGPAEVTLRAPPPLGVDLAVTVVDGAVQVHHGDALIATARSTQVDLTPPPPVSFDAAREATSRYRNRASHPLPECFVCGTRREPGDGLLIHAGPVAGHPDWFAADWVPDPSVGDGAGLARPEIVWGALDCPSYLGLGLEAPFALLGRLAARIDRCPRVGVRCVVQGWTRAPREGRKLHSASALYGEAGDVLAVARATWIVVDRDVLPA